VAKPYEPFDKLLEYAANADVGILLYPNDGIGNFYQYPGRLTEYAVCGLPFVASNYPGFESLKTKYRIGATCNPYDPKSIASAIIEICGNDDYQREEMRRSVRRVFVENLAYEHEAGHLLEAVRSLLHAG
jgi:glycosyltransferase involved in cell wall biosynthesis